MPYRMPCGMRHKPSISLSEQRPMPMPKTPLSPFPCRVISLKLLNLVWGNNVVRFCFCPIWQVDKKQDYYQNCRGRAKQYEYLDSPFVSSSTRIFCIILKAE